MLRQGSISQLRSGEISREHGYLVIAMCFYPRGIRREIRDEYRKDLAPPKELFLDWKAAKETWGHEQAFARSRYEQRFALGAAALEHLRELAARRGNVYLFCQCELGHQCHRELLLLTAATLWKAKTSPLFHRYPVYGKRLAKLNASVG